MQEIPAVNTTSTETSAQLLGSPTWETPTTDDAAFSGFLEYEATLASANASARQAPAKDTHSPAADAKADTDAAQRDAVQHDAARTEAARAEAREAAQNAQRRARERAEDAADAADKAADKAESAAEAAEAILTEDNDLKDMKDVLVDSESFQSMRSQLEKYGLSNEDIATLERRVNSEKGMTWGELVTFVSKNMSGQATVELDSGQRQQLMTFFQKLGFSGPEAQRMVAGLENGNADQVNAAVNERLTTLPQDKLATLDKDELDAFNQLLGKLQSQNKAEERGLIRVVGQAMENALDKARRLAQEQAANKRTEAGEGKNVKTLAQTASSDAKVDTSLDKAAVYSDETPLADQARQQARDEARLQKALSPEEQLKASLNKTGESAAKGAEQAKNQNADSFLNKDSGTDDKTWDAFLEKLTIEENARLSSAKTDLAKGFAENLNQAAKTASAATAKTPRTEAPHVVKQVEKAVLKNLSGGTKRLTLQLNPEHLGTVNLALSVKNSEVSATIRADNGETAKLIADQLEQIRQSLEEQGLKVSKLEVQTQLSGGDQGNRQGLAGQNNEFQQGMWSRMRSTMSNKGGGGFSAEHMSEMAREAILSQNGNGLHVVA